MSHFLVPNFGLCSRSKKKFVFMVFKHLDLFSILPSEAYDWMW